MNTTAPDTSSETPPADILAFNFDTGLAMLDNGHTVPILAMYDRLGDETEDPSMATALVAGDDKWGYWTVVLEDGDVDDPGADTPVAPLSNTVH